MKDFSKLFHNPNDKTMPDFSDISGVADIIRSG
jgi:hypothetical protein